MNSGQIIGREEECEKLKNCMESDEAQLVLVYGRRRVGKTFLVNEFFENRFDFKFTGEYKATKEVQLRNFAYELSGQTNKEITAPKDWQEAFHLLYVYIKSLPATEKHVVFFDEMPWMDSRRSGFLNAFEYFWNSHGSAIKNLVFIVCGSATSWLRDNIMHNKGGLYNRLTCRIYLRPFNLATTEAFLRGKGIEWPRFNIAECYMIMGGIPYYLRLLSPQLTYNENIDSIFFRKRAELWDEFEHLYRTLFSSSEKYIKVVEALGSKRRGLSREEISEITNFPQNGELTRILNDLIDSDFVRMNYFWGNKKKKSLYQLADYYTLFYYKFIKDGYGNDEHFWSHSIDSSSRIAWRGFTFEQLCLDHIYQIKNKLGIGGVLTQHSIWYKKADEVYDGVQIDLLIDRQDKVITICEMKFSSDEFVIDKEYDKSLRRKMETFRLVSGTKKGVGLAMITTYGVKKNMYSDIVSRQVILDDLFEDNRW